jgi:hypothetical protein
LPSKLPEWQDFTNEADFGNVMLQLFAQMGDIISYYQDRVANESFLATARTRRSAIEHLKLIGYRLATASPANATLSITTSDTTGLVTINKGDAFATKSQPGKPSIRFEYANDKPLTIDLSAINPKAGPPKTFYVPVEQGRLINLEFIGKSDGSPNQRFGLSQSPLVLRRLTLEPGLLLQTDRKTDNGTVTDLWTLRETLAFSGGLPDPSLAGITDLVGTRDYTIEVDEAESATIVFGDGVFGAIPEAGSEIRVTYRVGGGKFGNVPADSIQTIIAAPGLSALRDLHVTNPEPANAGSDREAIEHAVQIAPAVFRSLRRAVTLADYEALVKSFDGVGKVRAQKNGRLGVQLYVAPEGGGSVSDTLERNLRAYLEDKRMINQAIEIHQVKTVPIVVTAEVGVEARYVADEIQAAVQQAMANLLAFDSVDFGQTIYLSKFYEVAEAIPGVAYVVITVFRRDDQAGPSLVPTGKIELAPDELPLSPVAGKGIVITRGSR